MSTETIKDTRLFMDIQGGRIVCFDHLGGYGKSDVTQFPRGTGRTVDNRTTWMTPLDTWMVMEKVDRDMHAKMCAEYGMEDTAATCEDCKFNPDEVTS